MGDSKAARLIKALYYGKASVPLNLLSHNLLAASVVLAASLRVARQPPVEWLGVEKYTRLLWEVQEACANTLNGMRRYFPDGVSPPIEATVLGYALYNAVYGGGTFPIRGDMETKSFIRRLVKWAEKRMRTLFRSETKPQAVAWGA